MRGLLLAALLVPAGCAPGAGGADGRGAGGPGPPAPDPTSGAASPALMAPGVSRELAVLRAARVAEVRYALRLDLTDRAMAAGRIAVRFLRLGGGDVILDFRGRSLGAVHANGSRLTTIAQEGGHVRIASDDLRAGENTIELEFTAAIAPAGASIIRVTDVVDGADYLYTLLVPSDAHQLFPGFDQPDLKARLTLELVVPRGWTAVANGAIAGAEHGARETTFRFRETEPISTYLMAFAAGPWVRLEPPPGSRPIGLYVRASRAAEARAELDTLIGLNGRAVEWLERYFGRPYPFHKLDIVLTPAFPFGGMEHAGAIFYNEDRMIPRERPTLTQRIGRASLVYHEIAHQWFGNLVTMRWFDDLWLKEGFATYMAAKMQAELDPATEAWKTFHLRNKPAAYAVDVTAGTTPVWQVLDNLDQAKSAYGPIVYNKAPSVLKQLEYLVGEQAFRTGVRAFLDRHAFGNATWRELLGTIAEAAGRPLDEWGAQYMLRPGMPVLEQRLTLRDGRIDRLELVQRPADALSGAGVWPMRTELLLAGDDAPPHRIPVEISAETTLVREAAGLPAPAFVYANAGDHAYALVRLDPRSAAWLERHIGAVEDAMLRAMLWGAMWDLVRDARLDPARWVEMALRELPRERDEQIVATILGNLVRAVEAYVDADRRSALAARAERTMLRVAEDASREYGPRKLHLDAVIRIARTPETLARLERLLDEGMAAGDTLRPPARWAIVTTLTGRGSPGAAHRLERERARDSTTEGRRRAFVAGAAHPGAETKRAYFERYLGDPELNEDWATASLGAFNAVSQQRLTRAYLRPALDTLPWIQQHRRIFFLGAWLAAFLGGQTDAGALEEVERFLAQRPDLAPDLRQKVLQAADELRRTVAIRACFAGVSGSDAAPGRC